LATTKATVARSGSSSERVNETQNLPAMTLSILSSCEMINRMQSVEERVSREPAPSRHIDRGPLVTRHESENLPRCHTLKPAPKCQEHGSAGEVTGVPGVVIADRSQVTLGFSSR
jgi:hypothetical protein